MSENLLSSFRRYARGGGVATILALSAAVGFAQGQPGGTGKKEHQPGEKTSEALGKLKPLQDAQDWDGMIRLLESIPNVQPGSYDQAIILNMKAKLLIQKNQLKQAIEPWEQLITISENTGYISEKEMTDIIFFLAQLHAQEGTTSKVPAEQQRHFDKALGHFKKWLAKTPKPKPEELMTYASILYYKGAADPNKPDLALMKEARTIVEQGLLSSIKPREGFYQLLLTLQQQQNDLAGSAEILELLLKQSPNKKDYWQLLMASYLQLSERNKDKDPTLAREYLIRAIVTCERAQALGHLNDPKNNMNLVSLYLMANQFSKGTELLYTGMKSGKIESEPNNWRVLGRYFLEADKPERAIEVLKESAKLFPKNGEIEVQIAQIFIQLEKNREALAHAKEAIKKGGFEATKPFSVYYLVAYTAYDLGLIDEAHKAALEADKLPEAAKDPQFPRLKNVINEAIAERANKTKENPKAPASKKS